MKNKLLPIIILMLILIPITISTVNARASSFFVQKALWGTPTIPAEAGPGDQNVPLTVFVQYYGILPASSVQGTLNLPSGFSDANGGVKAIAYAVAVTPNSIFQLAFNLNIGNNVSIGNHSFSLDLMWNETMPVDLTESTSFSIQLKGKVKLSFETSQIYLNPGQVNNIPVKLNNVGNGNATDVSPSVVVPLQLGIVNQLPSISKLDASSSVMINLSVYVSPSAGNSPITFSFTTTYRDSYFNLRTINQNLGFIIRSYDHAMLKIMSSTNNLTPSQTESVKFTVRNDGSMTLKDIFLNLNTQPPINVLDTDGKFDLGTLNPGQTTDFSLSIYVSPSSVTAASITFTFSYTDPSSMIKSDNRVLTFLLNTASHMSPFSIKVQPNILIAGKLNNITTTVTNIGTTPLKSVALSFAFVGGQITWLEPDVFQIDELLPGENVQILAKAYDSPSASASTQLQILIKYYDTNNILNQEARNIGLLSQGLIDMEFVDFTILPETPRLGQIFSIIVTMTNIGTITASAVTATPDVPQGFKIFGSKSFFIGDVQTNSPTTFTISLQVDNNTKPGKYNIPVKITYFDNLRNPLSVTMNLTFNISDKSTTTTTTGPNIPGGSNLFGLIVPIIIAIAMLGIGFMLGKKVTRK